MMCKSKGIFIFQPLRYSLFLTISLLHLSPLFSQPQYEAQIILNERIVKVSPKGEMITTTHKIIQINNLKGMEKFKKIKITIDPSFDEIMNLKIKKLIQDKKGNISCSNYSEFNPHHFKKIISPYKIINLPFKNKGDIVEYEITIKRKPLFNNHFFNTHIFNDIVPVKKSVISIILPKDKEIYYQLYNIDIIPIIQQDKDEKIYTFLLENIPPLDSIDNKTIAEEALAKVVISSTNSWDEICEWFSLIFKNKIAESQKFKERTQELLISTSPHNKEEIIKALFNFVFYKIYSPPSKLNTGNLIPQTPDETLKYSQGNCKDKTLLLLSMLNFAQIKSYPALLNILSSIQISKQLPTPYYFNHAIVYIPEQEGIKKEIFLDPTLQGSKWNTPPPQDRGREILILNGRQSKFLKLSE